MFKFSKKNYYLCQSIVLFILDQDHNSSLLLTYSLKRSPFELSLTMFDHLPVFPVNASSTNFLTIFGVIEPADILSSSNFMYFAFLGLYKTAPTALVIPNYCFMCVSSAASTQVRVIGSFLKCSTKCSNLSKFTKKLQSANTIKHMFPVLRAHTPVFWFFDFLYVK